MNFKPEDIIPLATEYGAAIVVAFLIFFVGRWVVNRIVGFLEKILTQRATDPTLAKFACSIMRWVGLLFVVIAALSHVGIDTTSLVALLGAAGLAIGLSIKDSLANFAAGVMLIMLKFFKKGDFIEAGGTMGTVDNISIFTTTLTTGDNKVIIVPNAQIISRNITNFSARPTRRVDMVFGVSYDDDVRKVKEVLQDIIAQDDRVLPEPAPLICVAALADSSVNFNVRPWVKASDYWGFFWDMQEKVKIRFDEEGITIPFPQMDVHVQQQATPEPK